MKTLALSSVIALSFAGVAHADKFAVVDFDGDGIIEATDYIGPKSIIENAPAVTPAEYKWVETTRTVTVPSEATGVVPVTALAPQGTNYTHIGAYVGGETGVLEVMPATTREVVVRERVLVSPAQGMVATATVYPNPHGSYEGVVSNALGEKRIYLPPIGADGVITAAEMGATQDEFNSMRLAAYDTNKDGKVTVDEAIANLDPLKDPNVEAIEGDRNGVLAINSPMTRQTL